MAFAGVQNVVAAAEHAGGGGAHLDVVLSDALAVEHGVEAGDLVDADGGHGEDGGDLVHGREGQPAAVLALGEIEQGDDCGGGIVFREALENGADALVVLLCELERGVVGVVGGVAMDVEAGGEGAAMEMEGGGRSRECAAER